MTAAVNELHGHGDALLLAAMRDTTLSPSKDKDVHVAATTEPVHEALGHGDPLFQEVLSHDKLPKMALHSEFSGHGDEILDAVIEHWDKDLKEELAKPTKELHKVAHAEFQTQGDPILKTYRDHLKTYETEAGHDSTSVDT